MFYPVQKDHAIYFENYAKAVAYGGDRCPKAIHWRNRAAEANKRLIYRVAEDMAKRCPEDSEDLKQIGYIGLLRAVERFNMHQGAAFSSFAIPFIRGEIQHFLRSSWGVRPKINRVDQDAYNRVQAAYKTVLKTCPNASIDVIALNLTDTKGRHIFTPEGWRLLKETIEANAVVPIEEQLVGSGEAQKDFLSLINGRLPQKTRKALVEVVLRQAASIPLAERIQIASAKLGVEEAEIELRVKIGLEKVKSYYEELHQPAI